MLYKAMVKKTRDIIFICEECDLIWTEGLPIDFSTSVSFDSYAEKNNITPSWDELLLLN